MSELSGPVPSPGQWARVQLAQGESGAGLWDLSSDVPEARITVGSAHGAGWVVESVDVAPVHFEFFWDGNSLWVSPPHDGDLTVDGERVQTWRQLVGRSRVEFGRAAFLVETSQTVAMPPTGTAVDEVPDHRATVPGAPRVPSPTGFDDDPTAALMSRPDIDLLPPLESDATQMVDGAAFGGGMAPPSPGGIGRPMLGAEALPPLTSTQQFGGELKTQILDTEAAGISLRRSPLPPGPPPSSPQSPEGTAPGAALGRQRMIPTDVLPSQSGGSSVSETGSQFALPPSSPESEQKKKFELPPRRTLILAGATLLLAVIVLGSSIARRNAREEAVERANAQSASLSASATAESIRAQAAQAAEERNAARQAREAALREELQESIDDAQNSAEAAAEDAVGDDEEIDLGEEKAKRTRFAVQKLAVDALARNDQRRGLGYYLWLAEAYPDVEVYQSMVRVLHEVTRRVESR